VYLICLSHRAFYIILISAVIFTALTLNAQYVLPKHGKNSKKSLQHVNAKIIKNFQSSSKDAIYTPTDSPAPGTWNSNTYIELGWTDINVTETDNVSVVTVDYTWNTNDQEYYSNRFYLESPSGTEIIVGNSECPGSYSKSITDFCGEPMNGNWKLWIEDVTFNSGAHQATEITVTTYSQHSHDLGIADIIPGYVSSGGSVLPQVEVFNFGSSEETTYTVNLTDGSGYDEPVNMTDPLAANSSVLVEFPVYWTPSDGEHSLTATVTLAGDEDPDNDTYETVCQVSPGDYPVGKIYGYDGEGENSFHIILIDAETGEVTSLQNPYIGYTFGGALFDINRQEIIAVGGIENNIYVITADGKAVKIASLTGLQESEFVFSMAHDHINDVYYFSVYSFDTGLKTFYSADENWHCTALPVQTDKGFYGLACDAYGTLFGVEKHDDYLWTIDKTTGLTTPIGPLGFPLDLNFDIGSEKVLDTLYGTLTNGTSCHLGTINKVTGEFTVINPDLGGNIVICAPGPPDVSIEDVPNWICIYPNPSDGIFTIKTDEQFSMSVYDISGRILKKHSISGSYTLDLRDQPKGIYFIRFQNDYAVCTKKIIIQ